MSSSFSNCYVRSSFTLQIYFPPHDEALCLTISLLDSILPHERGPHPAKGRLAPIGQVLMKNSSNVQRKRKFTIEGALVKLAYRDFASTPKARKSLYRYIHGRFFDKCLSAGPMPPPDWSNLFFYVRSTIEWTNKCKELAATVKELSQLECKRLHSAACIFVHDTSRQR